MRGPTSNSKINERGDIDVSVITETDRGKDPNNHLSCSRTASNSSKKSEEEENSTPIWKVGRILIDSLSKGKMRRTKIFGVPLEDLPLNCQGLPKIVQRLCRYLEQFGLKEPDLFSPIKKYGKLVERYKISFDRAGDADLENCNDVKIVASLLKLWLSELPYPLIPQRISNRFKIIFQKYSEKELYDIQLEIRNVLITCPALNLGVLYTVVRLLHFYVTNWYPAIHVDQLPEMFAKILIGDVQMEHIETITTFIYNFRYIFNERILGRAFKLYLIRDKKTRCDENKQRELTLSTECENNSPLSVDKLIRSNSEEKLNLQSDRNKNLFTKNLNMRRVNSHEDFSGSQHSSCRSVHVLIVDPDRENVSNGNAVNYPISNLDFEYEPVVDNFQKIVYSSPNEDSEVLVSPPPFKYNEDYRVQEEIRNVERFTPQFNTYRTTGRRKRTIYQGHNVKPKVQAVFEDDLRYAVPKPGEFFDSCITDYGIPLESSSYNWNITKDCDNNSTNSTSNSSTDSCLPFEDRTIQEPTEYNNRLISYHNWSLAPRYSYNSKMLNSSNPWGNRNIVESVSPATHLSTVDMKILQVNKHLQWIKRKMKRFEKDFEDKFGETPTLRNKMAHPEYRQLSTTIICLKNNLKQLRKEANESFLAHRLFFTKNSNSSFNPALFLPTVDRQEAVEEAERHLYEKRVASERPECVENMTHDQLQDEKVSIQKELLHLENSFGQTFARNEELFKPIYARYRTVKRFLARSSTSIKLKETISDLATIMENETTEFDTYSVSATPCEGRTSLSSCHSSCNVSKKDLQISNIHELSSPELMIEYKTTKEEKKKLRNRIYMYEQEAENQTMNDSNQCIHSLRCRYKNTKAKLKLLEALLMKTK